MLDLTPDEWIAVRLSLRIAAVATVAALPFGIATAWLLARKQFWGKTLLDGVVHLPLVLPPVVTGYLLLISFGRRGPIGAFLADHLGIVFSFRWTGAALACGIMGFPLIVRPIRLQAAWSLSRSGSRYWLLWSRNGWRAVPACASTGNDHADGRRRKAPRRFLTCCLLRDENPCDGPVWPIGFRQDHARQLGCG